MQKILPIIILAIFVSLLAFRPASAAPDTLVVRSIDTMKQSRDLAREKLHNSSYDAEINVQMEQISSLGATHVAIATPYDEEFIPILTRWVIAARKNNLKVWFRGNFSGWEKWFNYPPINRATHTTKAEQFILKHSDLFANGDIFTSCPECENGGPGDPRNGDLAGHRQFLITEYQTVQRAFRSIGKQVTANYYSMNGDVALLVMDKATTRKLGGVVTVDHYVSSPEKLAADVAMYAEKSGGKVVLGEVGVPIPDLNGAMTEEDQAQWMAQAFGRLASNPHVIGVNYWVNKNGTTAIWSPNGEKRAVSNVIKNFYINKTALIAVTDLKGNPIDNATVTTYMQSTKTNNNGTAFVPFLYRRQSVTIAATGYKSITTTIDTPDQISTIYLQDDGSRKENSFITLILTPIRHIITLLTR